MDKIVVKEGQVVHIILPNGKEVDVDFFTTDSMHLGISIYYDGIEKEDGRFDDMTSPRRI